MAGSFASIPGISQEKAASLLSLPCPIPLACDLSITDSVLGQFELVCSDAISLFLKSDIVQADVEYLNHLCSQCRWSSEFEWIDLNIFSIPRADQGRRFVQQFLGATAALSFDADSNFQFKGQVMRKKARVMAHWAQKIGAKVDVPWENLFV